MNFSNKKINSRSMRDHAYHIIKDAIISGDLEPQRKLKDAELSDELGISRTPVREAMLKLEDEGFIVSKRNSYTMVSPINIEEAKDVYHIVIALESLALSDAIRASAEEVAKLEEINDNYKHAIENNDAKQCLHYDIQFHRALVNLSSNQELIKMLGTIKDKILRIESSYFHEASSKEQSLHQHYAIIDSMKNQDLQRGKQLLEDNWMNSLQHILTLNENQ
ncbi:GntR family transcriptional regulator [Geomicrobium sp. JCM 19038]|uniref:GntR family transcriptional regulator n=1 Tax=Geomicrobium sp. JCM 19038 TaxID=1460635 RepID=UPI00045F2A59|nr:GntR family transcriptional regulator [Geomicrobium sp. JCM 19038]GAK09473.1 transcriptional regulator, GntR family [Geomicrobium sp. JCM 19038]